MIKPILLTDIAVEYQLESILIRLHLKPGSPEAEEFGALASEAQQIVRPKAGFAIGYIEHKGDDRVIIEGVAFTSHVLRVNLEAAHRVFAYMATCGLELHAWAGSLGDILHKFWAEELKVGALQAATRAVFEQIAALNPGKMASMNPGSLPDWPIQQQKPFFALVGEMPAALGISLSDSYIMTPNKSVTGLRFSNETAYVNCRLCPRPDCPGRSAPYDAKLYQELYGPPPRD